MITISLTLNVQLDATDLAALDARLAALARGIGRFAESTEPPQSHTEPTPSVDLRAASAPSANRTSPPTAQNAPKQRKITPRPPKIPAPARTGVLPPVFSATANGNANGHAAIIEPMPAVGPATASHAIPFAEFDRLVRREMKRLAMDGRLPGHKLWDSERTPPLPTLSAVILRYRADGLVGLAEMLEMEPPLSVQKKEAPIP